MPRHYIRLQYGRYMYMYIFLEMRASGTRAQKNKLLLLLLLKQQQQQHEQNEAIFSTGVFVCVGVCVFSVIRLI